MLVTEFSWQHRQNNIIAKHSQQFFLHSLRLFVAGQAPVGGHLTIIISAQL